ncbi:hypothetical protein EYR38_003290 [Pleurotus pulmonarius]|nr:hypothetical protein EYR38_003290 [Pleurotus pulmonarius]
MYPDTTGCDIHEHLRIQLEAIQIHLAPHARNSKNAEHLKSFALLLEGEIFGEPKVTVRNYVWGDIDWHLEPPMMLEPDTGITIKVKRRNLFIVREEVLATFTFSDVAALFLATIRPRNSAALHDLLSGEEKSSMEFQQEHRLGTITVRFGVVEGIRAAPRWRRAMTPDRVCVPDALAQQL